jgi:cytochrome P450
MYGHYMQKEYNLGNFFYLDTWPFGPPILMILDPDIAAQVTQTHSLDKHPSLGQYLKPLLGDNNMVAVNGPMWKKLRSMFNPGFSLNHLMTQVPDIVDNTLTFVETMNNYAKNGRVFQCEEEATRLTVDIIGKVVL